MACHRRHVSCFRTQVTKTSAATEHTPLARVSCYGTHVTYTPRGHLPDKGKVPLAGDLAMRAV